MEIFCHNIPDHVSDNRLKKCFASILKDFGVHTYHCQRRRRGCATLTLMDAGKAQQVLNQYGDSFNGTRPSHRELQLLGRSISMRQSRNPADKILLRCLEEDELTRLRQATTAPTSELNTPKLPTSLQITSVSCGSWNYSGSDPIFVDYFQDIRNGTISFRRFSIRVSLEPREISFLTHEINFDYSTMSGSVYLGNSTPPTMTLSLDIAPRFFESSPSTLFQTPNSKSTPSKTRVSSLGAGHEAVVATCFAYRFTLMTPADLQVIHALKKKRKLPKLIWWTLPYGRPSKPLPQQMNSFLSSLNKQPLPYRVKFQLQMLVWNGLLSPSQVANLFFQARQLLVRAGPERAALVLRRLARKVPYLGPETESSEFDVAALVKAMSKTEDAVERENSRLLDTGVLHPNRVCVHKVTVTPVGTYLYGPNWESKNRVLRNHKDNTDYFIRVQFSEETGDPVRFDQSASLDQIFHKRFKSVLQDGIIIGGRRFEFLGFSHSSLRAQSCWFMAPFTAEDGTPLDARSIIPKLGDFSKIRSPAKCAARIGQAFSETLTSIPVRQDVVEVTDDIKRNGRVFSDGVGTISKSVMHMILDEYAVNAKVKPTVFQIRFAGKATLRPAWLDLYPALLKTGHGEEFQ